MAQGTLLPKIGQLTGVGVIAGVLVAALALPAVGGIGITARNVATGFLNMPSELETPPPPQRSTIYDADGNKIAQIYDKNRQLVPLKKVAPVMQDAIIAIEDSRFYEHGGIDLKGTFRAALRTLSGNTEGGSSLTQQYVKNVLVESADSESEQEEATEITIARKVRELRYAVSVEQRMTKDEILEGYLNIAYFGDGAYGVQSAARHFFSKDAEDLELTEAATIGGLVRYPYAYNPRLYPDQAKHRRNVVLDAMVASGAITKDKAQEAKQQDLGLDITKRQNGCYYSDEPFFCDYILRSIEANPRFGETEADRARWLRTAGLEIHTTLDPDMQKAAQDAVDKWVPRKNESHKVAAEVLVEPGTGQIRAMAQSRNYGADETKLGTTSINFTVDAKMGGSTGFQAGSTFKPYTLAAALDEGLPFSTAFDSPATTTVSGLQNCDGDNMMPWTVSNAGDSKAGNMNMVTGTRNSVNTYFAQLEKKVGLCDVVQMAKTLGVHRADGEPLGQWSSFTLGDQEVSPMTQAQAYAVFASRGKLCEPMPITKIVDQRNDKTLKIDKSCEQVISQDVADGVAHLLQGTFDGGTTNGLGIGRPAAAKTGTTDGSAYAWFAGFTPNLVGTVFVGDPRGGDAHPLRGITLGGRYYGTVYGATIPGPIWQQTMKEATEELPEGSFPPAPAKYKGGGSSASGSNEDANAQSASSQGGVPDVLGQPEVAAVSALEDAGYVVNVSADPIPGSQAKGSVTAVNPQPGSSLPEGAVVNVFLSSGQGAGSANESGLPVEDSNAVPAVAPTREDE